MNAELPRKAVGRLGVLPSALALHEAIRPKPDPHWHVCGIPEVFHTDHSADFTSPHLEQVAADLAMVPDFSTAGMPRGRGRIERFFQTVNQLFLCTLPGYAPPGSPPAEPGLTPAELDERRHRIDDELDYFRRAKFSVVTDVAIRRVLDSLVAALR